jgi:hypothetical protein
MQGDGMRITLGIAAGITLSILAHVLWKPTIAWALSRGDQ